MQILTPLFVAMRARQLGRQFRDIERSIRALRCDFPHLYGTTPESRYLPWGQGTDIGYERARSNNAEVALRGISLWLAVAYHETKTATQPTLQLQHRQLLQLLRELKEIQSGKSSVVDWMQESAVA